MKMTLNDTSPLNGQYQASLTADDDKQEVLDSGLPAMKDDEKKVSYIPVAVFFIVPLLIGTGIAYAIYSKERSTFDKRIQVLAANDMHWGALAVVVLGRTLSFLNTYPMVFKSQIMRFSSGNLRSNPFIFKAIGKNAKDNAIVFNEDGAIGAYNRANRSLQHLTETFGVLVAGLAVACQVFPFPVFVAVCVFGLARIMHQVGYTLGFGYHALGFWVAFFALATIEGLLFLIALKGFTAE
ncbi:hypothetical protein LEN26_003365 [Aphanomyces euteiches]|nr:hypothetical protein AeMF1_006184 [Aphanomyces euteiches]KAH9154741.1 hypothetical protein LEN26_003365 [Aphanomyces euteiches]KAH9183330.1 hypothetical protein AeNC1_014695 [Aphanomyces euteiches]